MRVFAIVILVFVAIALAFIAGTQRGYRRDVNLPSWLQVRDDAQSAGVTLLNHPRTAGIHCCLIDDDSCVGPAASGIVLESKTGQASLWSGVENGGHLGIERKSDPWWEPRSTISLMFTSDGKPGIVACHGKKTIWLTFDNIERLERMSRETQEPPPATEPTHHD